MHNIASYIDHTLLKPTATAGEIQTLCAEADRFRFMAVCVPPCYVAAARAHLKTSVVKVATVVGFPLGYAVTAAKLAETRAALRDGADEIDLVHNLTALKNGDWTFLAEEVGQILAMVNDEGKTLKVIIESGLLSDGEIICCCELYASLGVHFVKTSTGFASAGASVDAVQLMRAHLPDSVLIKASGGIRTFRQAREMIDAGAARLGLSAGVAVMEQALADRQ